MTSAGRSGKGARWRRAGVVQPAGVGATINPSGGAMWAWETPPWPVEARRRFDEDDADEMEDYDFDEDEELEEDYDEEEDEDYEDYDEEEEDYEDYDELEEEFDEEDEGPRPPRRRRDWE